MPRSRRLCLIAIFCIRETDNLFSGMQTAAGFLQKTVIDKCISDITLHDTTLSSLIQLFQEKPGIPVRIIILHRELFFVDPSESLLPVKAVRPKTNSRSI